MNHTNFGKSPKVKRNKLELDIERCRAECRWNKARDLITQLKNEKQYSVLMVLNSIVTAESKLERILNEKDSVTTEEAREVKGYLDEVMSSTDDNYKLEGKILLGKLRYQQKNFKEAVASLEALNLKNVKIEHGYSRLTKLISEGFAVIGLSLEEIENKESLTTETVNRIVEYLDLAGDIGLFHMQELEKMFRQNPSSATDALDELESGAVVTKIISKAIQRSPIVSIRNNQLNAAINRYRQLLRYCETEMTKPLRQTLARQLAEVLLRGVCIANYNPIKIECTSADSQNQQTVTGTSSLTPSPAAMWRVPAKYPSNNYKPTTLHQEVILLLLISEYLANQEAVLNRSPEHTEARISTLYNSQAVYDLLSISLSRLNCFPHLCHLLQHSLRFSYKEYHSWYQLSLALISSRHFLEAFLVLGECQRIDNTKPGAFHLAAALAIEVLTSEEKLDLGIQLAEHAIDVYKENKNTSLIGRSKLLIGRAYSLKAQRTRVTELKKEFQQKALNKFWEATRDDPEDWLSHYLLALERAIVRQLKSAMESCCIAVRLSGQTVIEPLHLLVLLHSATGRLQEAIQVAEAALVEHPSELSLLQTLAQLQLSLHGHKGALNAYRRVVEASRDLENDLISMTASGTSGGAASTSANQTTPSATASSTVAASTNAAQNVTQVQTTPLPLLSPSCEALLGLAQLYLDSNMPQEATRCLDTLPQLYTFGYSTGVEWHVTFLRARLHHCNGRLTEARALYESCLAVNSTDIITLQHLGSLLQQQKQYQLAEKTLREALSLDPNDSISWQLLGELFTELSASIKEEYSTISTSESLNTGIPWLSSLTACLELDTDNLNGNNGEPFDDSLISYEDGGISMYSGFNNVGHSEIVEYSIKCLTAAADLKLTDPIRSFLILSRAVKKF